MANGEDGLIAKNLEKYGAEYATWFISMLTNPEWIVSKTRQTKVDGYQGEYLIKVLAISVFLGATLGALIPDRPPLLGRAVIFVIVSLLWIFLSLLVHFACRLIGGKEEAQISISLMTQNLAFVYVTSNFLTLLITSLENTYKPIHTLMSGREFLSTSGEILFAFQFLILLYLVPITVSHAHGFKGFKWLVAAIFSACFAVLFGMPVFALGGC